MGASLPFAAGLLEKIAATLAHELKGSLVALESAARDGTATAMLVARDRVELAVHVILRMGMRGAVDWTPLDLRAVTDEIARADRVNRRWGTDVEVTSAGVLTEPLWADPPLVPHAIEGLVRNGAEACARRRVPARVAIELSDDPDEVVISVRDTGDGMTAVRLAGVLSGEEAFSSKRTSAGLGIPLALLVAHRHRGRLEAESRSSTPAR